MAKTTTKFRNSYSTIGKKPEYFKKYDAEDQTDQSQLASSSIKEMAKKYGIEAMMAKAEKAYVDNLTLQNDLYGHDFTTMQQSKEELLNIKKKINNLFENIPAGIRKKVFNDNVTDFVDAYTSNDVNKITALRDLGLVSDTQLNAVINNNKMAEQAKLENETRKKFITALEKQQGAMYENFKNTGNIVINSNKNTATDNPVL